MPARRSPRRLEARVKGLKDKTCWLRCDFLACWCGKVAVGGDCVIACLCVAPWSLTVGLGQVVCADGIHRARTLARYRLCHER